jgi:hypothetical protein
VGPPDLPVGGGDLLDPLGRRTVGGQLVETLEEPGEEAVTAPGRRRATAVRRRPPGDEGHDDPADDQTDRQERRRPRGNQGDKTDGGRSGGRGARQGDDGPHERFLGAVDVARETPQQIAPAEWAQPSGRQGHEGGEDPSPDVGEEAQSTIMGRQPLRIAEEGLGEGEGPDADDGEGEGLDIGVLGGTADQPDRGGGQGQAAHAGQGSEPAGEDERAPGPAGGPQRRAHCKPVGSGRRET